MPAVLIVAQSGRMLAESAARGGIKASVVDLFGDEDTRACAERTAAVSSLTAPAILTASARLGCKPGTLPLVYGSGVDTRPELIAQLAEHYPLAGNTPEAAAAANDPQRFFPLLDRLGIPHPETRTDHPAAAAGWLAKSACGEGGKGVAFCANFRRDGPGIFYQREQPGTACSLLFLADRKTISPIGFNTLWHDGSATQPFLFSGAVNRAPLNDGQRTGMIEIAAKLTASLDLRGINSLDFIADHDRVWLLELNPRPSATLQLYDGDWPGGLLGCHLHACGGVLRPRGAPTNPPLRAFRTVFAPATLQVPLPSRWPPFCSDRPAGGTIIPRHEPVCTVHALAADADEARTRLERLAADVLAWLEPAEEMKPNPSPRSSTRP
jgi:predicted ATP-grasp superfamily ATP-dependent carboligase